MKPSEQVKMAGLKSLTEMAEAAGMSRETLINWHKERPEVFRLLLLGIVVDKGLINTPVLSTQLRKDLTSLMVDESTGLKNMAQIARASSTRAYAGHSSEMRHIFDLRLILQTKMAIDLR